MSSLESALVAGENRPAWKVGEGQSERGNVALMVKAGCMQELPLNAVLFSWN